MQKLMFTNLQKLALQRVLKPYKFNDEVRIWVQGHIVVHHASDVPHQPLAMTNVGRMTDTSTILKKAGHWVCIVSSKELLLSDIPFGRVIL